MPYGLTDKECELIKNTFHKAVKVDEIILFGSRVIGNYKAASDIDFSVKGANLTFSDIVSLKSSLYNLPLVYKFDVIDYTTISNTELKNLINEFGC